MPSDADKPISPAAHTIDGTAAPKDDLVGTTLGHYRIVGRLGQGGMGVVYRAEDEKLRRTVALKVLPDTSGNEERRQRFLREARSAAAITHPNVAVVYAVDEAAGRIYIAMELVDGENLRARLDRGRLDLPTAKELAAQIARGLAAAHEKGIVHRDLKPENVMITPAGAVKLLDFGLAKAGVDRPASGRTEAALAKTETVVTSDEGCIMGTPEYMSPEQAMGEPLDVRSDVFSFGIVLYELLSGTRPFSGASTGAVLVRIARDDPQPLRERAPEVDPATQALVMRCLAKAPAQRCRSAAEIVTLLSGQPPPPGPTSVTASTPKAERPRGRGALALGGVALGVIVAVAILVPRLRATGPAPSSSPSASALPAAALPTAVTSLPAPKTSSPAAAREYASAMQSLRDASLDLMTAHLRRALELDPDFAAAHLELTVNWADGSWSLEDARKHLAAAVSHRSDLDARGLVFLEAVQPMLSHDLFDPGDAWRAAQTLETHFPMDAEMLLLAAGSAVFAGRVSDGFALMDRAAAADPDFAVPDMLRAFYQLSGVVPGGLEAALASSNRCLSRSPSATTCLAQRAQVEESLGQCSALEQDARRMIGLQAGAGSAYDLLAVALVAQGAPPESVAEAERRGREQEPDPGRKALRQVVDPIQDAVLSGDFATAIAGFPALDGFLAGVSSDDVAADFTVTELMTLREAGLLDRAVAVADAYMKRRPVLTQDSPLGARPLVLMIRRLAGRLSDSEFTATREAWASEAKTRMPPPLANNVWISFYAQSALSPQDARSALEALPRYSPLPSFEGDAYPERMMGQTLLRSGRVDDAIPYLRSAASACFGEEHVFSHNQASEMLGEALESRGNKEGACAAYAEVLRRWGHARPRSVTADAARAHTKTLGCAP